MQIKNDRENDCSCSWEERKQKSTGYIYLDNNIYIHIDKNKTLKNIFNWRNFTLSKKKEQKKRTR